MTVTQMPNQPSKDLAVRATEELVASIRDEHTLQQIAEALPPGVPVDRFVRATVTALRDDRIKTTDAKYQLVNADRDTLFQALVKCAADGLMPDGKQAALVVYSGKVQYLPMIGGVRQIAAEFGWAIRTHVAYENDVFRVLQGTEQRVIHEPAPAGVDRGKLVAAYAVAEHPGKAAIVEVMYEADVMKAKAVAKTDAVWKKWPAQMWEKTVGHRIAKKLPLDPQDKQRLTRVINAVELGPEESAATLYGPAARASFGELPSGVAPYIDSPQVSSGESPAGSAQPAAAAGDIQAAGGGGTTPGGGSTQEGPNASVASVAPDAAAATQLPEPDEEQVMLAAAAAEYVPPTGGYSAPDEENPERVPCTLAEILGLDGGRAYLVTALNRLPDGEWRTQVEAFARVHMQAEYAAWAQSKSDADSKAA